MRQAGKFAPALCTVLVVGLCVLFAGQTRAEGNDKKAIEQVVTALQQAMNKRAVEQYLALFAPKAELLTGEGSMKKEKAKPQVIGDFQSLESNNCRLRFEIDEMSLKGGRAVLETELDVSCGEGYSVLRERTLELVKSQGKWLITRYR